MSDSIYYFGSLQQFLNQFSFPTSCFLCNRHFSSTCIYRVSDPDHLNDSINFEDKKKRRKFIFSEEKTWTEFYKNKFERFNWFVKSLRQIRENIRPSWRQKFLLTIVNRRNLKIVRNFDVTSSQVRRSLLRTHEPYELWNIPTSRPNELWRHSEDAFFPM